MLVIDTNIVVRYLVADGKEEFAKATKIIESNRVSILLTVVLESEWVLRDAYDFPRGKIRGIPPVFRASDRLD
jgi:predicted nucleic-acid-binding protein